MTALLSFLGPLVASGLSSVPYLGAALAFFRNPVGRYAGYALIALSIYLYGFYKGDARADAKCADAAAKAELAAARQDLEAERKARLEDQSALEELRKKDGDNAVALKKLQDDLAKRPASTRCQWGG